MSRNFCDLKSVHFHELAKIKIAVVKLTMQIIEREGVLHDGTKQMIVTAQPEASERVRVF